MRALVLLHLPLEDAPHVLNRVQVILGHSITFISKAVVILAVCLGWLCWKQILKGGHNLLLQNVTVHVGIHVSLNEPQLPRTSSSHPAPDHDATTTMPDCRQGTVFLVLLTRASPHMLDTIWAKEVITLDSSNHRTWLQEFILLARLSSENCLQAFFVSQLQKRLSSGTTAMQTDLLQCVAYCLSTDKLTFHFCNR